MAFPRFQRFTSLLLCLILLAENLASARVLRGNDEGEFGGMEPGHGRGLKLLLTALLAKKAIMLGGLFGLASTRPLVPLGGTGGFNLNVQRDGQGGVTINAQPTGGAVGGVGTGDLTTDPLANGGIQVDPATGQAFIIDPATGQPILVDPNTGLPVDGSFADPGGIQIDPATGQAFTVDPVTGQTVLVDPNTGQPLVDGTAPGGVQIDPTTGQAFIVDPATGQVLLVDPATGLPLPNQG